MSLRSTLLTALVALASVALTACEQTETLTADSPSESLLTNQPPTAVVDLTVLGQAGCGPGACWWDYRFDAFDSSDPDGTIVSYKWVENGVTKSNNSTYYLTALRAYDGCNGTVRGELIVTDDQGATDSACYGYTPVQ